MSLTRDLTLRPATLLDADALTKIGIAAFPYDPQWLYRYPYAKEYPEDHEKFTCERYREWLKAAEGPACSIMVVEINDDSTGLERRSEVEVVKKVIAFSIWRKPDKKKSDGTPNEILKPPTSKPFRRDCNPSHMAAYRTAILIAQTQTIDARYGCSVISLAQLVTHPAYFRRGAGSLLLEWGISLAEKEKIPITLFAGPMAIKLYRRFGFRTVVNVKVQCSGEDSNIEFPGMKWEPKGYISKDKLSEKEEKIVVVYDENSVS